MPEIIAYTPELKILNTDQLPKGKGARYLEVTRGEGDDLVAAQWRRKPVVSVKGRLLVDFKGGSR